MVRHLDVVVGEKLFQFNSFNHWCNKAKSWVANSGVETRDTICIDKSGSSCNCGADFQRAETFSLYPIEVYCIRTDFNPLAIDYESLPEKTEDELELERLLNERMNNLRK